MAGALIGADFNDFLPDVVLVAMLLVLLTCVAYKTLHKAHVLHEKETLELQQQQQISSNDGVNEMTPINDGVVAAPSSSSGGHHDDDDGTFEARHPMPLFDVLKLVGMFVVVTWINLIKGGPSEGGGPIGMTQCGETCFWLFELLLFAFLFGFSIHLRHSLLTRVNLGTVQSDILWNVSNTISYPSYAIAAGLAAGLFGIGGGIIKGPLMLSLGVHPAVASATSACMILFTSSTATVSYVIFGNLIYDYALMCASLGFVATLIGQTVMKVLMERFHQRHSYIVYSIGFVVALSAICMTIEAVVAMAD